MYIATVFEEYKVCCPVAHLLLFIDSSIPQDSISPSLHLSCDSNEDVLLTQCIALIPYRDHIIVMIHENMFSIHIAPSL